VCHPTSITLKALCGKDLMDFQSKGVSSPFFHGIMHILRHAREIKIRMIYDCPWLLHNLHCFWLYRELEFFLRTLLRPSSGGLACSLLWLRFMRIHSANYSSRCFCYGRGFITQIGFCIILSSIIVAYLCLPNRWHLDLVIERFNQNGITLHGFSLAA